jgi:hypothetical protein
MGHLIDASAPLRDGVIDGSRGDGPGAGHREIPVCYSMMGVGACQICATVWLHW